MNHGDWIAESTHYLWDLAGERASNEQGGRHACHPGQREAKYPNGVPAARAKAGETLRLRYWPNGHSSYHWGRPLHKDPGLVRVYSAGEVNKEIVLASELTVDKMLTESNFSADAVTRPKEGNLPDDKVNWMQFRIPPSYKNGRYMFVWTWAPIKDDFAGGWRDQYTTCFDVFVEGKDENSKNVPEEKPKPVNPANEQQARIKKQCEETTCYKGGMKEFPCKGANCPPCRYGENAFDYDANGNCPPWAGGFDCKKGKAI